MRFLPEPCQPNKFTSKTTTAPSTIMVVISSPLGGHSCSNAIVKSFYESYLTAHPGVTVDLCDCNTLLPFTAARVQSKFKLYGGAAAPNEDLEWAASKELIDRFKAAECLVVGAPVWNFGLPSSLKLFFDHVVQPNKTFDSQAPFAGLVTGKPCFIARTSGRVEVEGPSDSGSKYLKQILSFMGFTHIEIMGMSNADPSQTEAILVAKCAEAAAKAAAFAFDPASKLRLPSATKKLRAAVAPKQLRRAGSKLQSTLGLPPNSKVLYISASPMGDHSASRKVCSAVLAGLTAQRKGGLKGVTVTTLDLAAMVSQGSLEPYTAQRVMAKFATFSAGSALTDNEAAQAAGLDAECAAEWEFTQGLVKQFSEHDVYVIGTPMWNFAIPFHLKAYLDHIIQPHSTLDPATYQGLLKGKRALVVATAGGSALNGPLDHVTPYLKQALGFVGVADVTFVHVNGTASPATAAVAIAAGIQEAKAAVGLSAQAPIEQSNTHLHISVLLYFLAMVCSMFLGIWGTSS